MLPKLDDFTVTTSWTNSEKSVVHLLESPRGEKVILKAYRRGFTTSMFRAYVASSYVARRLPLVPRVLGFQPWRNELYFSYISGQRVLEWVLQRFGGNLRLADFQSCHGLNPPDHVDPRIAEAFSRFRESVSPEPQRLKKAIRTSYSSLHRVGILHGSPDPRNIIYDGTRVLIIDFDHARPSLNPAAIDYRWLRYWYGLDLSCEADVAETDATMPRTADELRR